MAIFNNYVKLPEGSPERVWGFDANFYQTITTSFKSRPFCVFPTVTQLLWNRAMNLIKLPGVESMQTVKPCASSDCQVEKSPSNQTHI